MDSTFKVPLTKVLKVEDHPNADRLSLATVYGFQIIISRNQYSVGESVIYIPIDSIIDGKLEQILFPPDAKVRPSNGRIRQIKLRGLASQGLLVNPKDVESIVNTKYLKQEQDVAAILGITKYEPPVAEIQVLKKDKKQRKNLPNPNFHSYNGLTNLKWMPNLFDSKEVVIQEKIHGMNARAALLPRPVRTFWDKVKKLFGYFNYWEYVYGSNNVDITNKKEYVGYYQRDIHGEVFNKLDYQNKLLPNEIIYGEIYGPGIQENYDYGLTEPKFILFDVKKFKDDGTHYWLDPEQVEVFTKERGFDMVPVLYKGIYNKELAKQLAQGPSVLHPDEPVREGCVVKLSENYSLDGNKQALKVISEEYLANNKNSDNH
jgi:RNA ligase (TIGR02306 family)